MCSGERCEIILHPSFGYGESGSGTTIPGNSVLKFDIEALDYSIDDHEYPETLELRREAANQRQEKAKVFFTQNRLKRALACYEKAISLIEDDTAVESVKNHARWLSNTCLCHYKLNDIDNCIRDGTKSIEILKGLADEEELLGKTYKRVIRA